MSPATHARSLRAPAEARRGCALAVLAMMAAPACLAADCMPLRWGSDVVLRGVIEVRAGESAPARRTVLLRLPSPLCVHGFRLDGSPFRYEGIRTVRLGVPPGLDAALRDGAAVALRGELWWPASPNPTVDLTLALKEVL